MDSRGLLDVSHFVILPSVLEQTLETLARVGRAGLEAFVLWGGHREEGGRILTFRSAYVPGQEPHRTPEGLAVTLSGTDLHRANLAMYERGELLAAQVHSHPTEAYHSAVDDDHPIVTLLGALSIVVPDFAAGGVSAVDRWAWYRLVGERAFELLDGRTKVEVLG